MASLKDRIKKEKEATPTEKTVLNITGKASKKDKYIINVVYDGDMESTIKARAEELGLGVATYVKFLIKQDLNK